MRSSSSREKCPSADRRSIAGGCGADATAGAAAIFVEHVVVVVEEQKALPDGLMSSGCRGTAETVMLVLSDAGNSICAAGSMNTKTFSFGDYGC